MTPLVIAKTLKWHTMQQAFLPCTIPDMHMSTTNGLPGALLCGCLCYCLLTSTGHGCWKKQVIQIDRPSLHLHDVLSSHAHGSTKPKFTRDVGKHVQTNVSLWNAVMLPPRDERVRLWSGCQNKGCQGLARKSLCWLTPNGRNHPTGKSLPC